MATRLICDTNIWYHLGTGSLSLTDVQGPGEVLCFSPFSVLEIVGGMTTDTFAIRRDACNKMLDTGAICLFESDHQLAGVFGITPSPSQTDWLGMLKDIGAAVNLNHAKRYVESIRNGLAVEIDISQPVLWRKKIEADFVKQIISYLGKPEFLPALAAWLQLPPDQRSKTSKPKLTRNEYDSFILLVGGEPPSAKVMGNVLRGLYEKVIDGPFGFSQKPLPDAKQRMIDAAYDSLICYISTYAVFIVRIVAARRGSVGGKFEVNDRLDAENFLYAVDNDSIVVTSDWKWSQLAIEAGYQHRVRYKQPNT